MPLPTEKEIENLVNQVHSVKLLKQGGQKAVYRAEHDKLGHVVIKFVIDTSADTRIKREIEIVMAGHFPHVPTIYLSDFVEIDKKPSLYVVEQ